MGSTRDKIEEAKRKAIAPKLQAKIDKLNAANTDYLRIGNKVVRPRTTPPRIDSSYHTTEKRPAGAQIKKVTFGLGKDSTGKPIGQTTIVDLGLNPSAADYAKGKRMALNGRQPRVMPKTERATTVAKPAVAAKQWKPFNVIEEVNRHQRLSPHLPGDPHDKITPAYVWKREESPYNKDQAKSFSAGNITKALGAVGAAAVGAYALSKTFKAPTKKTKAQAVSATTTKTPVAQAEPKSVHMPDAAERGRRILSGTLQIPQPGATAQAKPALKVASEQRRAEAGTQLRHAGFNKPTPAKTPTTPATPVKMPKTPATPAKTPTTPTAPSRRTPVQDSRSFLGNMRDSFKSDTVLAEEKASRGARVAPVVPAVPAAVVTPPAKAKPAGIVKRVVTAPSRATAAVLNSAKEAAATLAKQIVEASAPADVAAELRAAHKANIAMGGRGSLIPVPAETITPPAELTLDAAKAKRDEIQARLDKANKTKPATKPKVGDPVMATPQQVEEVKQRDLARAKQEAARMAATIHAAERQPNVTTEQKLEATPDARGGERRSLTQRRGAERMTAAAARKAGTPTSREGKPAPKVSSRRSRGSDQRGVVMPRNAPEQDLVKQLEAARAENKALKAKKPTANKFGATEAEIAKVAKSGETTKPPTAAQTNRAKAQLATAPKEVQDLAKEVEAAQAKAAEVQKIISEAEQTSQAATSKEATKTAAHVDKFTPWSPEKMASSTPEQRAAYQRQLEAALGETESVGETPKEMKARKKATQTFYKDKAKRLEGMGSARKGTSTAVNPAVVGAPPATLAEEPPRAPRRPTEELIKEQGVQVRKIAPRTAPEADEVTEEWDKKAKNKQAADPLSQAKLDVEALTERILAADARTGTIGERMRTAARGSQIQGGVDVTVEGVGARLGEAEARARGTTTGLVTRERSMSDAAQDARLNAVVSKGGFRISNPFEALRMTEVVHAAREERRGADDRRAGEATRRTFATRATAAEATDLLTMADRAERGGDVVGAKKGTRREKQTGGDRRQAGSTWNPPSIVDQLEAAKPENQRPGGLPNRRQGTVLDINTGELKDAAVRGDPIAKELLKQQRAEIHGKAKERRATDTAPREAAKLIRDIEFAEQGLGKAPSISTWDPQARHPVPNPVMDVNADLTPKFRVYSGDPVKTNALEKMDNRIAELQAQLTTPGENKLYKGQELLTKMIRQREGLAQEIEAAKTRQFPTTEAWKAEGSRVIGETKIPDVERRAHVKDAVTYRPTILRKGAPQDRSVATPRGEIADPRTAPHEKRTGSTTKPAPDMSVGEPTPKERPQTWRQKAVEWSQAAFKAQVEKLSAPYLDVAGAKARDTKAAEARVKALGKMGRGLGVAAVGFTALGALEAGASENDPKKRLGATTAQFKADLPSAAVGITAFTAADYGLTKVLPSAVLKGAQALGANKAASAVVAGVTRLAGRSLLAYEIGRHAMPYTGVQLAKLAHETVESGRAAKAATEERLASEAKYGTVAQATKTRKAKEAIKRKQNTDRARRGKE